MHQLNAGQSGRCFPETLEVEHDIGSGLDVVMVLVE
jgi:hypothetical protein